MIAPFPLYVDEISPDGIKATVSKPMVVAFNVRTMSLDMPETAHAGLFGAANGLFIFPIGRFICMLLRKNGVGSGMILLDLVGKEELAERMAERVEVREKFMRAYAEVMEHPERHGRFRWVVGLPNN